MRPKESLGSTMTFNQLIDLSIGSPEPGHVNFYALHCLLKAFADKLGITSKTVDVSKYGNVFQIVKKVNTRERERERCCSDSSVQTSEVSHQAAVVCSSARSQPGRLVKKISPRYEKRVRVARLSARMAGGADPEADMPTEPTEATAKEEQEVATAPDTTEAPEDVTEVSQVPDIPEVSEPPEASEEMATAPTESAPIEEHPPSEEPLKPAPSSAMTVEAQPSAKLLEAEPTSVVSAASNEEILKTGASDYGPEMSKGVAIMKDQLELAMEQLHLLTNLVIAGQTDAININQLREIAHKLRSIQGENVYIAGMHGFKFVSSFVGIVEAEMLEHDISEEGIESETYSSDKTVTTVATSLQSTPEEEHLDLEQHLCYSPQKMLDQIIDLKSEACRLTNKVNDLAAAMLEQKSLKTMELVNDLQEQVRDLKMTSNNLKASIENIELKHVRGVENIANLEQTVDNLKLQKIDKSEIEVLLADKVNYIQLQRKVSHDELQDFICRLEKQFCEINKLINFNEKSMLHIIDNMRTSLGFDSVDEILEKFKGKMMQEIKALQETLQKYIDSTNDECAAAGARFKVLKDLACVSCDTTCVMRTRERAKVGILPSAHATALMSPLVTYELGSLRKSGVMGYYRKDEFPHAPNAWMSNQKGSLKMCVPRHAGGEHTSTPAREIMEKVIAPHHRNAGCRGGDSS